AASASRFLGGHPMAGKEHSGIENADASLFNGAAWIFTPVMAEPTDIAHAYIGLIASLGAHVIHLSPQQHDRLVAWTSHLPQMLSTAFAAVLQDEAEKEDSLSISRDQMRQVGGRAMREMTHCLQSIFSLAGHRSDQCGRNRRS